MANDSSSLKFLPFHNPIVFIHPKHMNPQQLTPTLTESFQSTNTAVRCTLFPVKHKKRSSVIICRMKQRHLHPHQKDSLTSWRTNKSMSSRHFICIVITLADQYFLYLRLLIIPISSTSWLGLKLPSHSLVQYKDPSSQEELNDGLNNPHDSCN